MSKNLRDKLIREELDYDKNINTRLAKIQQNNASNLDEITRPFIQLNDEEIDRMKQNTNLLKSLLEKKLLFARQFKSNLVNASKIPKYIIELGQTEEIMQAYNSVISVFLNPRNTQQTRNQIKNILISFEVYIISIINILSDIIGYMKGNSENNNIFVLVYAYTLYEIILKQFDDNHFYKITDDDMKHDYDINIKEYKQQILNVKSKAKAKAEFTMSDTPEMGPARIPALGLREDDDLPPLEDVEEMPGSMYEQQEPDPEFEADIKPYDKNESQPSDVNFTFYFTKAQARTYITKKKNMSIAALTDALKAYNEKLVQENQREISIPTKDDFLPSVRSTSDGKKSIEAQLNKALNRIIRENKIAFAKDYDERPLPKEEQRPSPEETKFKYEIKPEFMNDDGSIKQKGLIDAINKFENQFGEDSIKIPPETIKKSASLFNYLKDYIDFYTEDGQPIKEFPIRGSGRRNKNVIIPSAPVLTYNDIRNDPYYIIS